MPARAAQLIGDRYESYPIRHHMTKSLVLSMAWELRENSLPHFLPHYVRRTAFCECFELRRALPHLQATFDNGVAPDLFAALAIEELHAVGRVGAIEIVGVDHADEALSLVKVRNVESGPHP